MAIVLGYGAHAVKTTELTGLLVTIHHGSFKITYRQVSVAPRLTGKYLVMVWAVHGLECKLVVGLLALDQEELFAKLIPVTRNLIQLSLGNMRNAHALVTGLHAELLGISRQLFAQNSAARSEQWQTSPHQIRGGIQIKFLTKLAMVALFGELKEF